jgi:polysaccharide pyruvyl transferase WcaK-like protein
MNITRRNFLMGAAAAGATVSSPPMPPMLNAAQKARRILLRSSWQTVNIGDIAHTPGILHLFERHLPEAEIILWSGKLDIGVEPLLRNRFPKLRIARDGNWRNPNPRADDPTLAEAFEQADLLVHGSGSGLGAHADLLRWAEKTGKPYGAYGVSVGVRGASADPTPDFPAGLRRAIEGAEFLFTRETRSIEAMQESGVHPKLTGFAPDATFALDLRNDAAAAALMKGAGLEADKFICVVPRLRITPYWEIRSMPADEVAARKAVNEKYAEADHAKLREVIIQWIRTTGHKVLLCPEMTYEVSIIKPLLYTPLPEDVKAKVVPMDRYWLTDEAASVYRQARAVVSMECHSPIMACVNGRPAFYVRQPHDTWKGQMYRDLGLKEWIFEVEETSGEQIARALLEVHRNYGATKEKLKGAMAFASQRHLETMKAIHNLLEKPRKA